MTTERHIPDIRLVVADVDGSLLAPGSVLTERAATAVHALDSAGIRFAITSSRPPRGMRMLVEPLHLTTPLSGCNGGAITDTRLNVIRVHAIDAATAGATVQYLAQHGMGVWIFTPDSWFVLDAKAPHVDREAHAVQFLPEVVSAFTAEHLNRAVKIVGVSDDHDLVARAEANFTGAIGTGAVAARSQVYYLDVTHPDANKGMVVRHLSSMLGIPQGNIATLGDMRNDVFMFEQSGFSIAMGNASDQVKSRASVVTETNANEGFALAMEKYILNPSF